MSSPIPDSQIGPYHITREIGRGGMGVVYLARDERLDRDVAIKALPEELANDPVRLERFEREAKTLAQLNHSNIASIHGVEEQDGQKYLILEYVEGETLGERLDRGALPVDEVLELAIEIASGVEAAHEAGVIHRDLKPDNIKITPDGKVKVLDFGLARTDEGASSSITEDPTLTTPRSPTMPGAILGTAPYMSPEQARGRKVDKRTDIWSFGVILYEMLTGASPFAGETATDSIGAVLHKDIEFEQLPSATPAGARRVLARCLARDPNKRLHAIADARIELSDDADVNSPGGMSVPRADARGARVWLVGVSMLVLGALSGVIVTISVRDVVERPVRRYELSRDPTLRPETGFIISPDGRFFAYVQDRHLWIREHASFDARRIPDTEGATQPFWSPDGSQIGFAQDHRLRRVELASGGVSTICEGPGEFTDASGGAWLEDGNIVFTTGNSDLYTVPASGGQPEVWLAVDPDTEMDFHEVSRLPDGSGVLFVVHPINDNWYIGASNGTHRSVVARSDGASLTSPRYARSGHVLYASHGDETGLWVVPFEADRLQPTGDPFLIDASGGSPSVSDTGDLVYVRGITRGLRLAWQDAEGTSEPIGDAQNLILFPALSPDGRRVAVSGYAEDNLDVWIHEIDTGARRHLTFDPAREAVMGWTSDGESVAIAKFTADAVTTGFVSIADGSQIGEAIDGIMTDWAERDDGWIGAVQRTSEDGDHDIWAVPLQSGGEPSPLVHNPGRDEFARVSPDGQWLAFQSDRTGRNEVFLTQFPSGRGLWQVSLNGGRLPMWSPDGSRLYFLAAGRPQFLVVDISTDPDVQIGSPELTRWDAGVASTFSMGTDLAADGGRLLFVQPVTSFEDLSIAVVENWFQEARH